uniref:RING-type domain-containing protein n=1 Tax=Davidia involucrata TaxID=16924 RepID=A0A5B7BW46_DAVIN
MVLDLDLNVAPPVEDILMGDSVTIGLNLMQAGEHGPSHIQARTDLEPVDDEVVICSPRSFAEARDKSRRNRGVMELFDEETAFRRERTARLFPDSNRGRRAPAKQTTVTGDLYINLEGSEKTKNRNAAELPQIVPPPKEPTFSCPICIGPLVEETSTKCGHIFCKNCINGAIAAQKKCPTCRRKLKVKDTIRVYLPTSD